MKPILWLTVLIVASLAGCAGTGQLAGGQINQTPEGENIGRGAGTVGPNDLKLAIPEGGGGYYVESGSGDSKTKAMAITQRNVKSASLKYNPTTKEFDFRMQGVDGSEAIREISKQKAIDADLEKHRSQMYFQAVKFGIGLVKNPVAAAAEAVDSVLTPELPVPPETEQERLERELEGQGGPATRQ